MILKFFNKVVLLLPILSAQIAHASQEANEWFYNRSGVSHEEVKNKVSLLSCFPEDELIKLCDVDFPEREAISFIEIYRDSCGDLKLKGEGVKFIGQCLPGLKSLDLDANAFVSLNYFEYLPDGIEELKLIFNYGLADADFTVLSKFPNLKALNMQGVRLSQKAFNSLKSKSLRFLNFEANNVSVNDIKLNLPELYYAGFGDDLVFDANIYNKLMEQLFFGFGVYLPRHNNVEFYDENLRSSKYLLIDQNVTEDEVLNKINGSSWYAEEGKIIKVNRALSDNELLTLLKTNPNSILFSYLDSKQFLMIAENQQLLSGYKHTTIVVPPRSTFTVDYETGDVTSSLHLIQNLNQDNITYYLRNMRSEYNWSISDIEFIEIK